MSDVCGIFYKSCPQCAVPVAKSAAACHCGYSFEDETPTSALAQTLAEEKLYEDYLRARVAQTAQAAVDAQAAQKRQPADAALSAAARTTMERAEAARHDLAAQSARVEEIQQALAAETADKMATTSVAIESNSTLTAVTETVPAVEAPTNARAAADVAHAAEALRSELAKLRQPNDQVNDRALTPARVLRSARSEQRFARHPVEEGVLARGDNADEMLRAHASNTASDTASSETHTRASAAPAQAAVAPSNPAAKKRCPDCDAAVIASAHRCRCGFAFVSQAAVANVPKIEEVLARAQELKQARRESAQAQKAARIREARLARAAARPAATKPDIVAVSAPTPRADAEGTQPMPTAEPVAADRLPTHAALPVEPESPRGAIEPNAKLARCLAANFSPARPLATSARDANECPNCTANLAVHASRCKCGFELRQVAATSPMPALRLDEGEVLQVQDLYMRR